MNASDIILEQSLILCQGGLDKFRQEQGEVIGELLLAGRYKDVTDMFFKQGFLIGLRSARKNRETIIELI